MRVLAIDPGTHSTAYVGWDNGKLIVTGFVSNKLFLSWLRWREREKFDCIAIEMVACYGMAVGKEVFETCTLIGRVEEILRDHPPVRVFRKDVKMHLCQSMRAKDANIRQALIDRLGPQGTKKAPGPTYGIKSHLWAALAVAVYAHDTLTPSPLSERMES